MTAVLYIIMPNDVESMNSGKAIAQGSHASNAFVNSFHSRIHETNINISFYEWENETVQGFGTVLVLETNYRNIKNTIDIAKKFGYVSGMVLDPTYPILDGAVVHHVPFETCGFVFVPDKENDTTAKLILGEYNLHR